MKLTAFIESDSFQMGMMSGDTVPQWDEETLDVGITAIDTGLLIATYPDLENRKLSILVTIMDKGEKLSVKEKREFTLLGEYTMRTKKGAIDIGCVPSICGGTSGRFVLNKDKVRFRIYGDAPREPKRIILQFLGAQIIGVDANRLKV